MFCSRTSVNVRGDLVLTMSSSAGNLSTLLARTQQRREWLSLRPAIQISYDLFIADFYNNAPGAGTTISFDTTRRLRHRARLKT